MTVDATELTQYLEALLPALEVAGSFASCGNPTSVPVSATKKKNFFLHCGLYGGCAAVLVMVDDSTTDAELELTPSLCHMVYQTEPSWRGFRFLLSPSYFCNGNCFFCGALRLKPINQQNGCSLSYWRLYSLDAACSHVALHFFAVGWSSGILGHRVLRCHSYCIGCLDRHHAVNLMPSTRQIPPGIQQPPLDKLICGQGTEIAPIATWPASKCTKGQPTHTAKKKRNHAHRLPTMDPKCSTKKPERRPQNLLNYNENPPQMSKKKPKLPPTKMY